VLTVRLDLGGPLDLPASLAGLGRAGDDLLDRWDGRVWLRTVALGGRLVAVAARPVGSVAEPALLVAAEAGADPAAAGRALAGAVLPGSGPLGDALAGLAAADPAVARLAARWPGLRPVLQPDLLTAVVRAISAQQVNLGFAAVLRARLARAFGRRHPVPVPADADRTPREVWSLEAGPLAAADPAALRALQFSTAKAVATVRFAAAVAAGEVSLADLADLPDEEVVARLVAYPGIGRWTAEWLLARTLGRPRVVAGDLGVRKAVGAVYLNDPLPPEAAVRAATAHWGAAAGAAQQLLLHALAERAIP
jgi:DNA-3-methyladenine glycosylase II